MSGRKWTPDRTPLRVRIRTMSEPDSQGCWIWRAGVDSSGYGLLRVGGKMPSAHRASYVAFVGPIPEGLEIDHLCMVKLCVNPDHLDPVTRIENQRRYAATITACPQGHAYDESNTRVTIDHRGHRHRHCRACNRAATARRMARITAEATA